MLILSFGLLVLVELGYFSVARKAGIVDHPNDRTLHELPTIRGGGVVFYFSVILYTVYSGSLNLWFLAGLTFVAAVGLLDDIISLGSTVRFTIQVAAFGLVLVEMGVFSMGVLFALLIWTVAVAALNAYNFMDGVNGMTGGYSLVAVGTLYQLNQTYAHFVDKYLLIIIIMSLTIFTFFNFRRKAVCFAGDVGSYSIAFVILYLLLLVSVKSGNYIFILFLALYGVDTALTIVHRLIRRENIFKAHRLHLFQVLVYRYNLSHRTVSLVYVLVQLVINAVLIGCLGLSQSYQYLIGIGILLLLSAVYVYLKFGVANRVEAV